MKGCMIGLVDMKLGHLQIRENVYVAPIEDMMLIGLDFLTKYKAKIDVPKSVIKFGTEKLNMTNSNIKETPIIAKITIARNTFIRPNTVTKVQCHIDDQIGTNAVMSNEPKNC